MIRFNDEDVTIAGEVTDVYFNDNRVRRILKSMYTVNSAITLPSLVLLIPVSTTKTRRNFERKFKNICLLISLHYSRYLQVLWILVETTYCFYVLGFSHPSVFARSQHS